MKRTNMAETSARDAETKREVMKHFDEKASEYNFERTAAGYKLRHRLIKSLITREYKHGAVALDIGCGTGEYTLSLAQAGFKVVGGDLSKSMLAVAKSKIQKQKLTQKIQLIRLESTKLPFSNECFDAIACIALLEWVPDSHKLLIEANRVVKHQAKLIVCVDAPWSPYSELQRAFTRSGFVVEKFFGDILLAQVVARLLFDPEKTVLADKVLKATQPFDRHLTNLPFLKSLSAHFIIEARKE